MASSSYSVETFQTSQQLSSFHHRMLGRKGECSRDIGSINGSGYINNALKVSQAGIQP